MLCLLYTSVTVLQTLVIALGAGLGIWGAINLLEGYGNDNPGLSLIHISKMLYGILLDRMSLSAKNGWIDKNGRVYIIFTIDEAKMALNLSLIHI